MDKLSRASRPWPQVRVRRRRTGVSELDSCPFPRLGLPSQHLDGEGKQFLHNLQFPSAPLLLSSNAIFSKQVQRGGSLSLTCSHPTISPLPVPGSSQNTQTHTLHITQTHTTHTIHTYYTPHTLHTHPAFNQYFSKMLCFHHSFSQSVTIKTLPSAKPVLDSGDPWWTEEIEAAFMELTFCGRQTMNV